MIDMTITTKYTLMNIKKYSFLLLFIAIATAVTAQTTSPYSRYGLGNFQQKGSVRTRTMGGAAVGTQTKADVNNINPAALVAMDSTAVLFDIGFHAISSSFTSNDETQTVYSGNLDYVSLMIPMTTKWFLSANIMPLTSVGYNIDTERAYNGSFPSVYYDVNYNGKGGVSLATITNSLKLPWGFSLGAELGILWGNHNEVITESYINMDVSQTIRNTITYHRGAWAVAGLQYDHQFNKTKIVLGATYDLPTNISSNTETSTYSPRGEIQSTTGKVHSNTLPKGYGFGFSVAHNQKLTIAADYRQKQWGNSAIGLGSNRLTDNNIFSLGGEYIPAYNSNKYRRRVAYRGGIHHETGSFKISGKDVESSYISLGLGLPGRMNSTAINVGFEFGTIGGLNNANITETYGKLNIGLNLGEVWFVKQKFY